MLQVAKLLCRPTQSPDCFEWQNINSLVSVVLFLSILVAPNLMQLDSLQNQLPASALDRVLNSLQDIVRNVQIQSNFCISHPAYKPFELPAEAVGQQVPLDLQNKYLSLQEVFSTASITTALCKPPSNR